LFALKELNPALYSKNNLLEIRHANMLQDHPNIVKYINHWHYGRYIAFQIEYLSGGSLDLFLQDNSLYDPFMKTEKEILWYFLFDLLNALCFIHKKKIVHGDIKPSNIFIYPRNNSSIPSLKIGDFGLSRLIGSNTESFKKGDGQYLAPELLDSKPEITSAVDMFSLGITLYEMATDYTANGALWIKVCQNDISFDKISKDLKVLLLRMMYRDPILRIKAQDCLKIDKLQRIATQLGMGSILEESCNEVMMDVECYSSLTEQENENDDFMDSNHMKAMLDPVRKKLF
jgi:serine/threonine protein kinase